MYMDRGDSENKPFVDSSFMCVHVHATRLFKPFRIHHTS